MSFYLLRGQHRSAPLDFALPSADQCAPPGLIRR
jgi:hypothetical protein